MKKLINFLAQKKVKYELIKHKTVYTAYDKAKTLKVPEKKVGKTLVLNLGKNFALALIPANRNLDKARFKKTAKAKKCDFAKEAWMKKNLKGIKVGAVPPFGNLWKMPTFIDRQLFSQQKIIVNSGNYNSSIVLKPSVLKKVIQNLIVGNFSGAKK